MRIFKSTILAAASALAISVGSQSAFALDASKLIGKNANSSTVFELFFDFMNEGKKEDAVDVLKYAADRGNSAAQWKLARIYENGESGIQQDPVAAFKMYQKIAATYPLARPGTPQWQFSADALVALGNYYRTGIPGTLVFADNGKAQLMYTTAAMIFHHPAGLFELGRMQMKNENGFGQAKRGIRNLRSATDKGHAGAEALLGYALIEGVHLERDVVRGLVMLGNAKRKATARDLEWIVPLHDEAYAIARPHERAAAVNQLSGTTSSID